MTSANDEVLQWLADYEATSAQTPLIWDMVDMAGGPDACWPFRSTDEAGYGVWREGGQQQRAHRIAWVVANGPIPDGMRVCHHCDNPPCCNPSHLFLGTAKDNFDDMQAKGRGRAVLHAVQHGTHAGCTTHYTIREGEWSVPPCEPCRAAKLAYERERYRRGIKPQRSRRSEAEHGTRAGLIKHYRVREGEWSSPPCQPCRDAGREYDRLRREASKLDG